MLIAIANRQPRAASSLKGLDRRLALNPTRHAFLTWSPRTVGIVGCVERTAAVLAWVLGFGFGLPGVAGIRHLARTGQVWTFLGFPTYGEGPLEKAGVPTSAPLLAAFVAVCAGEVAAGVLLWRRRQAGRLWALALLPFELVFWWGFALPFGPPLGLARTALMLASRRRTPPDSP